MAAAATPVTPHPASETSAKIAPSITELLKKTFLVPVDGSKASLAAFNNAIANTSPSDKIILFHGESDDMFHPAGSDMGVIVVKPNVNASANSSSLKDTFLNKCAEKQRTCEWINKTFVGGSNALANEIYKLEKSLKIDGIIMGARGLSPLDGMILGSVSHAVLIRAQVPVTVVRQPKD